MKQLKCKFNYSKSANKFFIKHKDIEEMFKKNIINENPNTDIKALKGFKGLLRMRIKDYRIIFKVVNGQIIIIEVLLAGNRGEIYKKL